MERKIKLSVLICLVMFIIFSHRAYLSRTVKGWGSSVSRSCCPLSRVSYVSRGQISPLSDSEQRQKALAAADAKAHELGIETGASAVTIDLAEWNMYTVADPEFWFKHKDLWEMLQGKNFFPVRYRHVSGARGELWVFVDTKFFTVIAYLDTVARKELP